MSTGDSHSLLLVSLNILSLLKAGIYLYKSETTMKKLFVILIFFLILFIHKESGTQTRISRYVFGSGITLISDSNKQINGTIGQAIIGVSENPFQNVNSGFWYPDNKITSDIFIVNENEFPVQYLLEQNYPNPFNNSTTIQFSLPELTKVTIKIYNILGREILTLAKKDMEPGTYKLNLTADDMESGLYFYRIITDEYIAVKKLMLVK